MRTLNDVTQEEWSESARKAMKRYSQVLVPMEDTTKDKIVESVVDKYRQRSQVGIQKYGTTLERNDLSFDQWLNHISEELMDAVLYIERVREANRKGEK